MGTFPLKSLKRPNLFETDSGGSAVQHNQSMSVRCPHCRQNGTFRNALGMAVSYNKTTNENTVSPHSAAIYQCPNRQCHGLIFAISDHNGVAAKIVPPTQLDFDPAGIPSRLLSTLTEAVSCHAAGCYRACALMVRRLIEELCDEQNATGSDLRKRLENLRSKVPMSDALLDGATELRILGNDAAHVVAKEYASIGAEEAELSIEVAKEVLKALYQHHELIERLKKLKTATGPTS